MCCRACASYEICRAKGKIKDDDCCPDCQYFNTCMEEFEEIDNRQRRPSGRRLSR